MQIYRKKSTEFVNFVTYLTLYEATEGGIELVRSYTDKFVIGASDIFVSSFTILVLAF